ncbi:MAG: DUF932 domain-containing protein, partial [Thermodesulfobacteriota bacterium]
TPIRVVCQNTLILAMEDGEKSIKVRHTKTMSKRLAEVPDILGIASNVYNIAEKSFQALAKITLNKKRLDTYLEAVFPPTKKQKQKNKYLKKWDYITELFEIGDPDLPDGRGTLWSAYNAVTQFEDYRQSNEISSDRRLNRIWFGAGADLKLKAFEKAMELASSWN